MVWRRWGDSRATPLVLLHGGYGSWRHFALNVLDLAKHYCVYAADLPGLGDSAPLNVEYNDSNLAATVSGGINRVLPPDMPFHICGFSFGGIIGGPVAVLQGERGSSYTGVAAGGLGMPNAKLPELASPQASMSADELAQVHRHNLGRLMISDLARVDTLAVYLQTETVRRARASSGKIPFSTVLAQALPNVSKRARVNAIWGRHDAIAGQYIAPRQAYFAALPNAGEFQVLENAGHWLMYERPDEFTATLLGMLAKSCTAALDKQNLSPLTPNSLAAFVGGV